MLECKSRKSSDTWNNRQVWPWITKWSRAKDNRVLTGEHTGHSKISHTTTQVKTLHMDITKWSNWNQTDHILCSRRWRSYIQPAKTKPGVDYGSDHELFIAKFRLKLKKVGKTTRSFSSVQSLSYVQHFTIPRTGLQHTRFLCPSPSPRACSNSCTLSRWCCATITSSIIPFSCLQSFLASGSSHQVVKVLELHPQHQSLQWIFRIDFL